MYKGNPVLRVSTQSSQTLPTSSRRETTLWQLLIWAFKTECVLAVVGQDDWRFISRCGDSAAMICDALALGHHIPGPTVTGGLDVHEDALLVYNAIRQGFGGPDAWVLMDAGRRGEAPKWRPNLPDVRVRPVMDTSRKKPKPEVWYRDTRYRQGFFCPIIYTGFTDEEKVEERARAKARYVHFIDLMKRLHADMVAAGALLSRWHVLSLGVVEEPWSIGCERGIAKRAKT